MKFDRTRLRGGGLLGAIFVCLTLGAPSSWAAEGQTKPKGEAETPAAEADEGSEATSEGGSAEPPVEPEPEGLSPLNPRAEEFPKAKPAPATGELDALLAEIAALRSRVAALTTSLFSSRLRVVLSLEGEYSNVRSLVVTLDGGVVYRAPERFSASEELVVYEHAVAPGQHTLGIELERVDTRGKTYASFQANRFALVVPDKKRLEAHLELEDDSDIAEDFPEDQEGHYELSVELEAQVVE